MPAGTITLTNNSTAVLGAGTNFIAELKVNDFIVAVVGGTTYTLGVSAIGSATAITLTTAYGGPTVSGIAWTPIPNGTLVGITAQVAADTARAIRGLNFDKANWQQVYSSSGNITVTLPDGSAFTGPSWASLANNMENKLDITGGVIIGSVTFKSPTTNNKTEIYPGFVEIHSTTPVIDFHYNNDPGDYTSRISEDNAGELTVRASGTARFGINGGYRARAGLTGANGGNYWNFNWSSGQLRAFVDTSDLGAISFTSSDRELKEDIAYRNEGDIDIAHSEVMLWKPATFKFRSRGVINDSATHLGFIANDLQEISPHCVVGAGLDKGANIDSDISSAFSLEYSAMIAKLAMAIQHQSNVINILKDKISKLENESP